MISAQPILLAAALACGEASIAPAALEVTYLANEGFLLRTPEHAVLFDAFVSEPYAGYAALPAATYAALADAAPPFDAIDVAVTSHVHGDHFQPTPACEFLAASTWTVFVSSPQVIEQMNAACPAPEGDDRRRPLYPAKGHTAGIGHAGVRVEAFPLPHGPGKFASIQNLGHVVTLDGFRILHLGDAHMDPKNFAPYELPDLDLDVALVPYWYFGSAVVERLLRDHLKARFVVAMHIPTPEVRAVRTALAESHPDVIVFERALASRELPARDAESAEPASDSSDSSDSAGGR